MNHKVKLIQISIFILANKNSNEKNYILYVKIFLLKLLILKLERNDE